MSLLDHLLLGSGVLAAFALGWFGGYSHGRTYEVLSRTDDLADGR